jgi:hypothetical protein
MQCRIQPCRERFYYLRLSYNIVSANMAGLFDSVNTERGLCASSKTFVAHCIGGQKESRVVVATSA